MLKKPVIPVLGLAGLLLVYAFKTTSPKHGGYSLGELRKRYGSGDPSIWPPPVIDSMVAPGFQDIGLLPKVKYPKENPYTKEKSELGKVLFFDPKLSGSKQIACASCHDSQLGWGDGRRFSFGHDRLEGKRNAMALFNIALVKELFWDGRASSIEDQVHFPLEDTLEMASSPVIAVGHIQGIKAYKAMFARAYGDSTISFERIVKSIATFERGIVSKSSRFDRFIAGQKVRYSDMELEGLHLFRTKARCINCHNTPLFSDNKFHNTGLTYYGRRHEDLGRYGVTGRNEDVGKFRTAALREIGRTAPYMHNGLFPRIDGIINLYNAGMPRPKRKAYQLEDEKFPQTSGLLRPLALSPEEKAALEAFLHTLTSNGYLVRQPGIPSK